MNGENARDGPGSYFLIEMVTLPGSYVLIGIDSLLLPYNINLACAQPVRLLKAGEGGARRDSRPTAARTASQRPWSVVEKTIPA